MSYLEKLHKQAKLYLRWHRAGAYPVAAQIRAGLPVSLALRPRNPAAVLQARRCPGVRRPQAGFESWPALEGGMKAMSTA